jgi:hypothetical protein
MKKRLAARNEDTKRRKREIVIICIILPTIVVTDRRQHPDLCINKYQCNPSASSPLSDHEKSGKAGL